MLFDGEVFPMSKPSGSTLAAWLLSLDAERLERVLTTRTDAVSLRSRGRPANWRTAFSVLGRWHRYCPGCRSHTCR
jgi:hypothetical protein